MEIKKCQKCYKEGHLLNECKNKTVYKYRPSKSEMIKNGIIPYSELKEEILIEENENKNNISENDNTSEISVESSSLSSEHKEIRRKLLEKIKFINMHKEKMSKNENSTNNDKNDKMKNNNSNKVKNDLSNKSKINKDRYKSDSDINSILSEESQLSKDDSMTSSFSENEYKNVYTNKKNYSKNKEEVRLNKNSYKRRDSD